MSFISEITVREGQKKDVPSIFQLILELAKHVDSEKEVTITVDKLLDDGFTRNPPLYSFFVAELDHKIVGMALYFLKYSTWKGKCIYLEDFIVQKEFRGRGIGKLLFNRVAMEAKLINAERLEWQVIDSNTLGIDFYKKNNSLLDESWINCKLTREQLQSY